MPFTNPWDETEPSGLAPASSLETIIQKLKLDLRERLDDVIPGWSDELVDPKTARVPAEWVQILSGAGDPDTIVGIPARDRLLYFDTSANALWGSEAGAWVSFAFEYTSPIESGEAAPEGAPTAGKLLYIDEGTGDLYGAIGGAWVNLTPAVTVDIPPSVLIDPASQPIAQGAEVVLTATGSPPGGTYKWFVNNAEVAGETTNSLTVTIDGTTVVRARYTDADGLIADVESIQIVSNSPAATIEDLTSTWSRTSAADEQILTSWTNPGAATGYAIRLTRSRYTSLDEASGAFDEAVTVDLPANTTQVLHTNTDAESPIAGERYYRYDVRYLTVDGYEMTTVGVDVYSGPTGVSGGLVNLEPTPDFYHYVASWSTPDAATITEVADDYLCVGNPASRGVTPAGNTSLSVTVEKNSITSEDGSEIEWFFGFKIRQQIESFGVMDTTPWSDEAGVEVLIRPDEDAQNSCP